MIDIKVARPRRRIQIHQTTFVPRRRVTGKEEVVERGPLIRGASLMEVEDWQIVRSTPLFGTISKDVTASLVGTSGPRFYEKGALLFQQGDPANAFYVILEGWVKIA